MGFRPDKQSLKHFLSEIDAGKLGIPEFQRDFKWEPNRTVALLCSVLKGYPIGSILTWVPAEIEFGRRSFYLAPPLKQSLGVSLILDGQQRLTSLFLGISFNPETEWKSSKRGNKSASFWLNIKSYLENPDEPELFITYSLPIFRRKKYIESKVFNLESRSLESFNELNSLEFGYYPLHKVFHNEFLSEKFENFPSDLNIKLSALRDRLKDYELPYIEIDNKTGIDAVAFIFEKVNNSGLALDTFELLNAKLYKHSNVESEKFHLRDMWKKTHEDNLILSKFDIDPIYILQAICLDKSFSIRLREISEGKKDGLTGVSCKKKDLFNLSIEDVRSGWDTAVKAICDVVERLSQGQILGSRWFPYSSAVVPMAVAFIHKPNVSHQNIGEKIWNPLVQFYWNTVFQNRYSSSVESLMASDLIAISSWINGGSKPHIISDGNNVSFNFRNLIKANSAIYQGVICLLINRDGKAKDFHTFEEINHDMVNEKGVDDHHIFPRKSFAENDPDAKLAECVLNRTLINPTTNRTIGKKKPRVYLDNILKDSPGSKDDILKSHFLPNNDSALWDNFHEFLDSREVTVVSLIKKATGWNTVKVDNDNEEEDIVEDNVS